MADSITDKIEFQKPFLHPATSERWPIKSTTVENLTVWQFRFFFFNQNLYLTYLFTSGNTNLANVLITLYKKHFI